MKVNKTDKEKLKKNKAKVKARADYLWDELIFNHKTKDFCDLVMENENECPCDEELIPYVDFEGKSMDTDECEQWQCPICRGLHIFDKEVS